ncbi:SCP2 sterol-binding domain-containing protein [Microbulbifer elongatus]|uniref:SCP2 sterol-binding domain-containing protein n=1 Tax=Microbulbifer elongatus TaxID=86173 RepID=A0ABT1P6I9_9GAMM|nr:SCP2 sterol-binding domain-containing protein [Microbulbifer elongatus]MCQ3830716.1 SCP2 sterol-binding domain-containing protein [Microbulbifer elongatus]
MSQRLNSIDEVIHSMDERFQPDASKGVDAKYQWIVNGDNGKEFCIHVNNGAFSVLEGRKENPDVTFETDEHSYLRLVNNELKGMTAILTRKLLVKGNIYLASKMDNIFK